MGGWMGGRESGVKDCLQQSKIKLNTLVIVEHHELKFDCELNFIEILLVLLLN
jgi:hypothetical protein